MSGVALRQQYDMSRLIAMWLCLALFLARVLGQVEALLIAPMWLPSMESWYSGLLPYPLLLPVQIVLLMFMAALTWHQTIARHVSQRSTVWKSVVRTFAIIYFLVMAARLVVQWVRGAPDLLAAGAIPVAFHWVLALFLLLNARSSGTHDLQSTQTLGQSITDQINKVVAIKSPDGFRRRSSKGVVKSL